MPTKELKTIKNKYSKCLTECQLVSLTQLRYYKMLSYRRETALQAVL